MCSEQQSVMPRDFYILLISAFFIYTYNNVFMVATPLIMIKMGSSQMIAGLQATFFLITAIILRFFFGPFSDQRGRRLTMLLGSASFLFSAIFLLFAVQIWQVIALRLLQAVGLAAYFPAATATAATCAGRTQKGTYIGFLRVIASLSLMFGPVFALYLINNYNQRVFLQVMVILSFLGSFVIFFISPKIDGLKKGLRKSLSEIPAIRPKHRFLFIPLFKNCFFIVGTTFTAALSFGIFMSFATLYIDKQTDIINAGFFFTLFSLGGVLANGILGWLSDLFGRLRITIISLMSLGIGIILFTFLPCGTVLFFPAGLLIGTGYYGSIAVLMAWMTEKAEIRERTTALSLQQNAIDLGIAAGSGIFGILLVATNNATLLYGLLGFFYLFYALLSYLLKQNTQSQL